MFRTTAITLAASLALAGTSSLHAENPREPAPPTQTVYYGDLNLTNEKGVAVLKNRVKRAANSVCFVQQGTIPLELFMAQRGCVRAVLADAQPRIAAAINRSRTGPVLAANQATIQLTVR